MLTCQSVCCLVLMGCNKYLVMWYWSQDIQTDLVKKLDDVICGLVKTETDFSIWTEAPWTLSLGRQCVLVMSAECYVLELEYQLMARLGPVMWSVWCNICQMLFAIMLMLQNIICYEQRNVTSLRCCLPLCLCCRTLFVMSKENLTAPVPSQWRHVMLM
jgi:hypothetical protein